MPIKQWRNYMVERLHEHPEEIPGYLNASLVEPDGTFLIALKTVVEARIGGAAALSRGTGLHRVSLQNMLTAKGNPRLSSLVRVLDSLGLRLAVVSQVNRRPKARDEAVQ